jgi:hypothetical protein
MDTDAFAARVRALSPGMRDLLERDGLVDPDGYPTELLTEESGRGLIVTYLKLAARITALEQRVARLEST